MTFAKSSARELQLVDPVLTTIARRFKPEGFIYSQLAPTIPVDVDSGLYPIFDKGSWFRSKSNGRVSDRAETPEIDFSWSTTPYLCEDFRLQATITRKERKQAHPALRLEEQKLEVVLNDMALNRETRLAAKLRDTSFGGLLAGGTATPSVKWDQGTTGSPATIEKDVKTGKVAVYRRTGKVPNTLVLPYLVACEVALDPSIREIMKYTVNGQQVIAVGEAILPATLWGMRVVIPMGALVDTGREGAPEPTTLTELWGDSVRLLYVDSRGGGWGVPSVAYSFKSLPEEVDKWHDNDPPVDHVRAWECVTEEVCAPELGYELSDTLNAV